MFQPIKNFIHTILGLFFIVALAGILLSGITSYAQSNTPSTPAPTNGQQLPTGGTTTNNESTNTTGGSNSNGSANDEGLQAFQILNYECIFKIEGCEKALLDDVLDILIGLAPIVATLVIIWGGYKYFMGGINGKEDGRKAIEAAIIGLALVLSANYIIGTLIPSIFSSNGINGDGIKELLNQIKKVLFDLSSAVAVLVIIWGGYKYLFSGLNGKEDGRKTIEYGVIGFVVILIASKLTELIEIFIIPVSNGEFNSSPITESIVQVVNKLLIPIATALTVFFIVIAGYKWIFTDSLTKAGEAKKALTNALIGFVVILLSVFIVQLIYLYTPYAIIT